MKKRISFRAGKRITAYMMMAVMAVYVISVPSTAKTDGISDAGVSVEEISTDEIQETGILDIQSEELSSFAIAKGEFLNKLSGSSDRSATTVNNRNWQQYRTTYVFDQMDAKEKALYNELESVCMDYIKNSNKDALYLSSGYYLPAVSIKDFTDSSYADVLQLFVYANPQYYFTTSAYGTDESESKLYMYCYPSFADGDDRAEVTNSLFSKVDEWLGDITEGSNNSRDIEKACHDYLCDNVSYDTEAEKIMNTKKKKDYSEEVYQTQSVYSTLTKGSTVCAGYSLTFELLLNAAGVPAVTTYSDGHAWNKVYIDDCNRWYAVDVTWDDDDASSIIGDYFYNKSDENIKEYDGDSGAHKIKLPEYYPAAEKDFEASDVIVKADDENQAQNQDDTDSDVEIDDASTPADQTANNDENDESSADITGTDAQSQNEYAEDDKDIVGDDDNSGSITLYLDTNGGEALDPLVVKNGDSIVLPRPVRSGYVFEGWYYMGEPIGKNTVINKDSTLVAQWSAVPVQDSSVQAYVSDDTDDNDDSIIEDTEDEEEITVDTPGLSKVKASGSKKCKVTWKKVSDVTGYEIQLSKAKNFKKVARKAKVSKKSSSVTVNKLKKKTTYYVRVRAYKNVDGKTITSDWSGVKKVTIK